MKEEDKLISKYGKESGMKVPEGYFADLQSHIMSSLPPYQKTVKIETSRWQRVKPYVYLAAMFCGIWLMMKVFHTATQPLSLNLDNPPEALVELIDNGWDDYEIHYTPSSTDFDLEDEELIMSYDNFEDFEKDFGYDLKPEYSTISYEAPISKNS